MVSTRSTLLEFSLFLLFPYSYTTGQVSGWEQVRKQNQGLGSNYASWWSIIKTAVLHESQTGRHGQQFFAGLYVKMRRDSQIASSSSSYKRKTPKRLGFSEVQKHGSPKLLSSHTLQKRSKNKSCYDLKRLPPTPFIAVRMYIFFKEKEIYF